MQWLDENSRRCPGCATAIEKQEGCDQMTCAKVAGGCGHEFCWKCGADYDGPRGIRAVGNSAHEQACTWFFADPEEGPAAGGGAGLSMRGKAYVEANKADEGARPAPQTAEEKACEPTAEDLLLIAALWSQGWGMVDEH